MPVHPPQQSTKPLVGSDLAGRFGCKLLVLPIRLLVKSVQRPAIVWVRPLTSLTATAALSGVPEITDTDEVAYTCDSNVTATH
jgi:hypothetical protein